MRTIEASGIKITVTPKGLTTNKVDGKPQHTYGLAFRAIQQKRETHLESGRIKARYLV